MKTKYKVTTPPPCTICKLEPAWVNNKGFTILSFNEAPICCECANLIISGLFTHLVSLTTGYNPEQDEKYIQQRVTASVIFQRTYEKT